MADQQPCRRSAPPAPHGRPVLILTDHGVDVVESCDPADAGRTIDRRGGARGRAAAAPA